MTLAETRSVMTDQSSTPAWPSSTPEVTLSDGPSLLDDQSEMTYWKGTDTANPRLVGDFDIFSPGVGDPTKFIAQPGSKVRNIKRKSWPK